MKIAIDGFVSIGGPESLEMLRKTKSKFKAEQKKQEWLIEAIGQIENNIGADSFSGDD